MKKKLSAIFLFLITILLTGCKSSYVTGSGNIVEETRNVSEFNQIKVSGYGKLFISQGDKTSVIIKSDDNLLPIIKTEVVNKQLKIYFDEQMIKSTVMEFYVVTSNITAIKTLGYCQVLGQTSLKSNKFAISISGYGKTELELEVETLSTNISGSGSIILSGRADSHSIIISGSGKINALNFDTSLTKADIRGSGNCKIDAKDNLYVSISGSGKVEYKGNPKIKSKISGSGRLSALDD